MEEIPEEIVDVVNEWSSGRRVVNGRTQVRLRCINLCHGFGRCHYCNDHVYNWVYLDENGEPPVMFGWMPDYKMLP